MYLPRKAQICERTIWTLVYLIPFIGFSQTKDMLGELNFPTSYRTKVVSVVEDYKQGNLQAAKEKLTEVIERDSKGLSAEQSGFLYYFRGILGNRVQDFKQSAQDFESAIRREYFVKDIFYEYGQALYAGENVKLARDMFIRSAWQDHKVAVSLYYFAYLSAQLEDRKLAVDAFRKIRKLKDPEKKDVIQAAEMQIGDIYQQLIEKKPEKIQKGFFEKLVLPQYEKAQLINKESMLAKDLDAKLYKLKKRYGLIFDELVNGRPVMDPRYFIRFSQEIYQDSNVIFQPEGVGVPNQSTSSLVSNTQLFGRYTFYGGNVSSFAPEIRLGHLHHFERDNPSIFQNDALRISPAFRTSYEYMLFGSPASLLLDYEGQVVQRDYLQRKSLDDFSTSHGVMLGQRFRWTPRGDSVLRYRFRDVAVELPSSDTQVQSVSMEQVYGLRSGITWLFYLAYDRARGDNAAAETDSYTFRVDYVIPRIGKLFSPSFALTTSFVDPINQRESRGLETLIAPSFSLSRTFNKNYRVVFRYDYFDNNSDLNTVFSFKRHVYGLRFEYVF